jgi:methyltransferase (TIGR00027 family)
MAQAPAGHDVRATASKVFEVGMSTKDFDEDPTIADPVGATSRLTAAARARETARPDRLFDDRFAVHLAGQDGFEALDRHNAGLAAAGRASPNPVFAIRTRFFDDFLLAHTVERGVRQVVLVAAGLDVRAFRLAWPVDTRVFELDQDEVLADKDVVLHEHDGVPTCDRVVVPVDLREPWRDRLVDAGYRTADPAVWLAEGLTFYLSESAVRTLFGDIAHLARPGDALGCDFVTQLPPATDAAKGFITDDPAALFRGCGWHFERYAFDSESERLGRPWPSPVRPYGYMTIAHRVER